MIPVSFAPLSDWKAAQSGDFSMELMRAPSEIIAGCRDVQMFRYCNGVYSHDVATAYVTRVFDVFCALKAALKSHNNS